MTFSSTHDAWVTARNHVVSDQQFLKEFFSWTQPNELDFDVTSAVLRRLFGQAGEVDH